MSDTIEAKTATPAPPPAYAFLEERFARLGALQEAAAVLQWDTATMMAPGGAEARGEQLATLDVLAHGLLTESVVGDALSRAADEAGRLDRWQQANLREMRRQQAHATALPEALVAARSRAVRRCETLWRQARPQADFALVLPALDEVLRLTREAAGAKAAALGLSPYDALLDEYEPGGRCARIDEIFDRLAANLPGLLGEVLERQAGQPAPLPLDGPFPLAAQEALGRRLMARLGFDFEHGRVDVSAHPFCGGTPDDIRLTTRYDETDFTSAIMGVLHETGHALYEAGLPARWRRQPVGAARGMALHESQSLLMEMQACRSPAFIAWLAPVAAQAFGGAGEAWSAENLQRLYRRVEPGFIRVDADEVTYPAHVILRYRLERSLLSGDLALADLPGAWNEGLQGLLGITPPDDRLGCLQDIHWYDGAWGYFPTYTLGAMAAAQLFAAACAACPGIPEDLGRGEFATLVGWLRREVHGKGSLLSTDELLQAATGQALDPAVFESHLRRRYLG